MALSLPTTSSSNTGLATLTFQANVSSSLLNSYPSLQQFTDRTKSHDGIDMAASANAEYILISNATPRAGQNDGFGGFPQILTRSGNTITHQQTIESNLPYSNSGADYFGYWSKDDMSRRWVDMDLAGETIVIGGTMTSIYNKGRFEIWSRSGSTWSFAFGHTGNSIEYITSNGCQISGNGNYVVQAASADVPGGPSSFISIFAKTGGTWAAQQTITPTKGASNVAINNSGDKIVVMSKTDNLPTGDTVIIYVYTRSGTTWSLANETTIDQTGWYASYANCMNMSGDGNYIGIGFRHSTNNFGNGRLWIGKWNGTSYAEETTITKAHGGSTGYYFGKTFSFNDDGSRVIIGTIGQNNFPNWTYQRVGTTWTYKQSITSSAGSTGENRVFMDSTGNHILWANCKNPENSNERDGLVHYYTPTATEAAAIQDGDTHIHQGRNFKWNAAKSRWRPARASDLDGISSSRKRSRGVQNAQLESDLDLNVDGVTVSVDAFAGRTETYANASIFPFSSLQSGDQAIALDTGYLYVTDGSGWFKVANSQPV
tara:strand:+ start:1995 stop:3623 length:1629 start_codon:yes stop_codon:yes gene_type:complete